MLQNEPALIVTVMKNEGPYILEWVAHHMAIGFDSFLVMTNDCDDGTDRILDRLEKLINLKHVPNPKTLFPDKSNWHIMAHRYGTLFNIYRDAGWIYFTDCDEFLHIWTGDGHLEDFHAACDGFDVVSFTSMPFSSSGVVAIEDKPLVEQFTIQSKDYEAIRAGRAKGRNAIKSMFHNKIRFAVRRNHRPRRADFSASGYKWVDGSGRRFSDEWVDGAAKDISPLDTCDLAQFNHYAIRSAEAYLNKIARGDAVGTPRLDADRRLQYWRQYDARGTIDTRATTRRPEAVRINAELRADPHLAELHAASVAQHQARAKAMRAHPEIAALLAAMAGAGHDQGQGQGQPAT